MDQMAESISQEMGAPISLSRKAQAPAGLAHLAEIVKGTMVLKPSEMAPVSAYLFAQIVHEAAVPPGVFNLVKWRRVDRWRCGRSNGEASDPGTRRQIGQNSSRRCRLRESSPRRACKSASVTLASAATRRPACWFHNRK
jgi:hypothetical protein